MARNKTEARKSDIANAVSYGFSELADLASEVREVVDNCPENLQQTDRISTLESTADTLEGLDEPTVPESVENEQVEHYEEVGRRLSRASRRDNAVGALNAVLDRLNDIEAEIDTALVEVQKVEGDESALQEKLDEVIELRDEVENAIGEAEGVEFPGMFG